MSFLATAYKAIKESHSSDIVDPRFNDYPLVSNFPALFAIMAIYLLVVLKWGPAFMANRRPYNVTAIMQIYNVIQVIWNLYLFSGIFFYFRNPAYSWSCFNVDKKDVGPHTVIMMRYTYSYFLNKFFDLLDTIFFVLRKKNKQISFLHLYHHVMMIYAAAAYNNFMFGTPFTVIGIINSFVHVIMYFYYFMAARSQDKHRLDAWKPRLTQLQILQFLYIGLKSVSAMLDSDCDINIYWILLSLVQDIFMIALFSQFYWRTYILKKKKLK